MRHIGGRDWPAAEVGLGEARQHAARVRLAIPSALDFDARPPRQTLLDADRQRRRQHGEHAVGVLDGEVGVDLELGHSVGDAEMAWAAAAQQVHDHFAQRAPRPSFAGLIGLLQGCLDVDGIEADLLAGPDDALAAVLGADLGGALEDGQAGSRPGQEHVEAHAQGLHAPVGGS
jgi:hypothetical protein